MRNQKSVGMRSALLGWMLACALLFSGCHKGYEVLYEDDFSPLLLHDHERESIKNTASTSTTASTTARLQQPEVRHRSRPSDDYLHGGATFRPQQPGVRHRSRPSDDYLHGGATFAGITRPRQPEVEYRSRPSDDYLHGGATFAGITRPRQPEVEYRSRPSDHNLHLSDRNLYRNAAFTDITRSQQLEAAPHNRLNDPRPYWEATFINTTRPQQLEVEHRNRLNDPNLRWTYPPRSREIYPNQAHLGQRSSLYQQPVDSDPRPIQCSDDAISREAHAESCPICDEEDAYKTCGTVQCTGCKAYICQLCHDKIRESASVLQDYDYHNDWTACFQTEFACPLCRKPF